MSIFENLTKLRFGDPFFTWMATPGANTAVREDPASGRRAEVLLETYPACFYTAILSTPDGLSKKLQTGSGPEIGHHLETLCVAFFLGQLELSTEDEAGELLYSFDAQPDGHDVNAYAMPGKKTLVVLEERTSFMGVVPSQSLMFDNPNLALSFAKHASEGMVGVSRHVQPANSAQR